MLRLCHLSLVYAEEWGDHGEMSVPVGTHGGTQLRASLGEGCARARGSSPEGASVPARHRVLIWGPG